jgi:hypothetical protein
MKIEWPELRFPPINLWNVWPTKEQCALHAETQDKTLWENYDDRRDKATTKGKTLV